MKKLSFIFLVLLLSAFLAACGDNENKDGNDTSNPVGADNNSNNEVDNAKENDSASNDEVSDTSFDNGEYIYEIKEVEQITSQYDDSQVLAVEISFTNNTDEPTSPWMALGLSAEQETETTVEGLDGANGLYPEDYKTELVEMGDTDIKPGATVDAVIGFEILYPGEPVRLYNFSFTDEVLFERIVETTE